MLLFLAMTLSLMLTFRSHVLFMSGCPYNRDSVTFHSHKIVDRSSLIMVDLLVRALRLY